jgi:hypothetical protein
MAGEINKIRSGVWIERERRKERENVTFTVVSQIVLLGALLEWVKNEESEVSGSGLLVSFLLARAPFLPAASNEFSFDSVASLLGLIVPSCLRAEAINRNRKIERDEIINPILL